MRQNIISKAILLLSSSYNILEGFQLRIFGVVMQCVPLRLNHYPVELCQNNFKQVWSSYTIIMPNHFGIVLNTVT